MNYIYLFAFDISTYLDISTYPRSAQGLETPPRTSTYMDIHTATYMDIHTWLRTLNADLLHPLNHGLNSAWRLAQDRERWRQLVETATLQPGARSWWWWFDISPRSELICLLYTVINIHSIIVSHSCNCTDLFQLYNRVVKSISLFMIIFYFLCICLKMSIYTFINKNLQSCKYY